MNIDDYRALKAQEAEQAKTQTETTPSTPTQPTTPVVEQPKTETPVETPTETKLPEKFVIDGIGEVTAEELKKGYLRQSDYTKKTQDLAKKERDSADAIQLFEALKKNPQMAEQLKQSTPLPAQIDPATAQVVELRDKVYDMMLEQEINLLQSKYKDFDVREVLQTAQSKNLNSLEDAYLLNKSTKSQSTNPEALKEQLRQEILQELQAEKSATSTIITSNSGVPVTQTNQPHISEAEHKVAQMMRLSDADYVKWRDIDKKK